MDSNPNYDQRRDAAAPDLTDYPDGDPTDIPFEPVPVAQFSDDDDDFVVFEERLTDVDSGPLDDGSVMLGMRHPSAPVSRYRTYVVSAAVTNASPPFQLLPAHPARVSTTVVTTGRGVRIAPTMGDLPIVGALPAMYPDGSAIIKFDGCYTEPITIDGYEVPPGVTVKVYAYVSIDLGDIK